MSKKYTRKEKAEIIRILKLIKKTSEKDTPTRLSFIDKYIEEYSKSTPNPRQSTFIDCIDPKSEAPDIKNTVRVYKSDQFVPFLEDFFKKEGKDLSNKLEIPKGGFYLELVKNKTEEFTKQGETALESLNTLTGQAPNIIESKLTDFLNIIYEAYIKPTQLINRVKKSEHLQINALIFFLFCMAILASIIWTFIDLSIPPSIFSMLIKDMSYSILSPFLLIFELFLWIPLITMIPYFSYKAVNGKATFYQTLNFNIYFISSWLPFVVLGFLKRKTFVGFILLVGFFYMIYSYLDALNKLMDITNKKRYYAYLLTFALWLIFYIIYKFFRSYRPIST